jgi:ribokinase
MAKFLQQLLNIDEPLFTSGMLQLEKATGESGVDTRLIADMTHAAHDVMRQLGMDTSDTTAEELYGALVTCVKRGIFDQMLIDTDYVLMTINDQIISFNIIDVIENAHHELSFDKRIYSHGQRSLRGEIVARYLEHPQTTEEATRSIAAGIGLLPASDADYAAIDTAVKAIEPASTAPFILAIGDIVTDAFIALEPDQAQVTTDTEGIDHLSMEFGAKLPYDHVDIIEAVGNSANAAVSFTRLGVRAGLMAFIGEDQAGKDSLKHLAEEHVDTTTVSIQKDQKSNYHYVLRYNADRTILIKYESYAYDWQPPTIKPDWIYLSMISEASWQLHLDMMQYLNENPTIKLAFQPGTFHFKWGVEKLKDIYSKTEILMLNREEAGDITGLEIKSIHALADGLHALGPKTVIITDGPDGAYASDGTKVLSMPNYPDPAPPYERTGAGDAFASTLVAMLAQGHDLGTALLWAPINSMSVVQKLGAQAGLLHPDEIQTWLDKAPETYKPTEFTE